MIQLESIGLQLRVGERVLVSDLDFRMNTGETWIILGANGSGKTTLLHTLAGLHKPDAGSVCLDNEKIGNFTHRQRARRIGISASNFISPLLQHGHAVMSIPVSCSIMC